MYCSLHFTLQTRPSLSHNEARAQPEELNSGNKIWMKIIKWRVEWRLAVIL